MQKPGDHNSETHEVNDPVRREIRLIVGVEWLQEPMRNKTAQIWHTNGHRHHEGKDDVGDRQPECRPGSNNRLNGAAAAQGDPGAEETCEEWKSYPDRLFNTADRNRDGHLDPSEFAIIRRAGNAFAEADFGYFDENQDGKITRSEFVDKPSEFILKFDKNGDCRVTQDEMKGASTDQKPPNGRGKKF